jgi:hypothetical protein
MFKLESELQALVDEKPEVVLGGIPEISPDYCSDVPAVLSLGREISLSSGPIDNLLIDANAILTFVECKRHGDGRLKREVYSQAINYASDMQNMLHDFNGAEFLKEFFDLMSKAQGGKYHSLDALYAALSKDAILAGKNIADWQAQFKDRLELNIKRGIFRVIILCGASPESRFSASMVRNLMQIMTFAEKESAKYDLLLMDISEAGDNDYVSRIIWRRYAPLPQIPLLASASRDTSKGIEAMRERRSSMASGQPVAERSLMQLLGVLDDGGYSVEENTHGFAVFKNKKSIFTTIRIEDSGWKIVRHQIRRGEILHSQIEEKSVPTSLATLNHSVTAKISMAQGANGGMYEVVITPPFDQAVSYSLFQELSPRSNGA